MNNVKQVGGVYSTTNYEQFSLLKTNRKLDLLHVNKISINMKNQFFITISLIERGEDGTLYVRDGQHRLHACKQEEKPFYFAIVNDVADNKIVTNTDTLSALQFTKQWLPSDFANYYSKKGHPGYGTFCEFMDKTGFPSIASYICLTGHTGVAMSPKFKRGYFRVDDEERAYILSKIIQKFHDRGMGKASTNPRFVSAVYKGLMRHTISLDKLYRKVERNKWHGWIGTGVGNTLAALQAHSWMDTGISQKEIDIKNKEWPYSI